MALMLLVASGLMVRTLLAIQRVEPGFTRPDQIQMVRISLPQVLAREPERVIRLQRDIVDKLAAIPGVAAVGFTSALPLENNRNGVVVALEGMTALDRMPPEPEISPRLARAVRGAGLPLALWSRFHLGRCVR